MQSIPEAVAIWRLQIKRSRVRFPHWNFLFFFLSHFFPLSFSSMLAPPFQCSSIFIVIEIVERVGRCDASNWPASVVSRAL